MSAPVITAIRRYPVKAMAGESLLEVQVNERGLELDRWFAVVDADGRYAAGKDSRRFRRREAVFDYAAAVLGTGVVVRRLLAAGSEPAEWSVADPVLAAELSAAMDAPVRVQADPGSSHHDAGAVSLIGTASLHWLRTHLDVDADVRRIRANLVVETVQPFEEESWPGREITVGGATLRVVKRIERCRVVDLVQDGVATRAPLLKTLGAHRDLCLGIYADVVRTGRVAVGDRVQGTTGGQPISTSSNGRRGVAGTGEP